MTEDTGFQSLKIDKKTHDLFEEQINVAKELRNTNRELFRNARLIENMKNHVQKLDNIKQFEHLKSEAKHIIRDLTHLETEDEEIKKLGGKIISRFKSHRLKIKKDTPGTEAEKIKIITIDKKEIIRDEQRVIDLIENNNHTIKQAFHNLTIFSRSKFGHISQSIDAQAMIARALIHIKQVYVTSQAIIQLEAQINKEEAELEEGIEELKKVA